MAAFPYDGYSMAADPDSFEDDCRSDDAILSGGDASGDNHGSDSEEVLHYFPTSIRAELGIRSPNTVGNESAATVSSSLPFTIRHSSSFSHIVTASCICCPCC